MSLVQNFLLSQLVKTAIDYLLLFWRYEQKTVGGGGSQNFEFLLFLCNSFSSNAVPINILIVSK
jgi:hypothetical protein